MNFLRRMARAFERPQDTQRIIDLDDPEAWRVFWPHVASQVPVGMRVAPNGEGMIYPAGNILVLDAVAPREFWEEIEQGVVNA